MAERVSKSQFKPRSLEYFRRVQETGESLVITDRGKPVLKIVPYAPAPEELLAALRDSVLRFEALLEPVGLEDWDALR
jgi:prevent-host-death family protein